MTIADDVKTVCDRLALQGWRELLLDISDGELDISQSTAMNLTNALASPIKTIHRTRGFEDFHQFANQGITGGRPSHSLLYHALASPFVHPTRKGVPSTIAAAYATLAELDVIENYIYSIASTRSDLSDAFIAVLAYQYRVASRTSHLRHADMCYSRTGIARIGTARQYYDPSRRSFWVIPKSGGDGLPVLPARYAAFLVHRATPGAAGSVQSGHNITEDAEYVFPVHKLFPGKECLAGQNIDVKFLEFHRNEKLRMIHQLSPADGGLALPEGFDASRRPFVRDSNNGGKLVSLKPTGASVLVVPRPASSLVRTDSQKNSVTNTSQIVHFIVPESERRVTSSLRIPPERNGARRAPEFVSIRHEVDPDGPPEQAPRDLNTLSAAEFEAKMREGGYPAAHFSDDTCDGCVEAIVKGMPGGIENLPAFSLVTAPDFFPLADQLEVETNPTIDRARPLSRGRLPANPRLPRPSNPSVSAFSRRDVTITAVVGGAAFGPPVSIEGQTNRMVSFLPDAASNVFAPGWDVSRSQDGGGVFLTSFGLGSPFPEDAKLCAAIGSFWPAVAPDNGRTFGNDRGPRIDIPLVNQLPMLDEELGFHPNHERVVSNDVKFYRGWDGEFGPFFELVAGKLHVNYVAIERSDYVRHALDGRIRVSLTADLQSEDLIARNRALEACRQVMSAPRSDAVLCLVVFRKVDNWQTIDGRDPRLIGGGFLLEFAELSGSRSATSEIQRVRKAVSKRHICQFGENGVAFKDGSHDFSFVPH